MYGVIINQNGYMVNRCVILDEDNQPQWHKLQESESVIQFEFFQ